MIQCLESHDPVRFVRPRASRISGLEIPPPRTTPAMLWRWAAANNAKVLLRHENDGMAMAHIDAGNGITCTATARAAEDACSALVCKLLDETERIQNEHPNAEVRSAARIIAASIIYALARGRLFTGTATMVLEESSDAEPGEAK